jgi:renalase
MSIAIIGAGLSGLTAARTLSDAGFDVSLFEKSRGTGGRMASRRSEAGDLDLGAQYFTARHPDFQQAVANWQQRGWVAPWQPVLPPRTDRAGALAEPERWVGTPSMSALTRGLRGELPAHFACRIEHLKSSDAGWTLVDSEGQKYGPFSQVIVTLPAPQAAALLIAAAPGLAAQAAAVAMRPTWVVALGFARPLPVSLQACFVRGPVLDWLACNSSKPGRNNAMQSWILHADSDWSKANHDLPADQVIAQLSAAFADAIGHPLPPADLSLAHRWLYARAANEHNLGTLGDAEKGIYLCGDWCLSGRIEGAWLSGRQAAQQILSTRT